MQIKPLARVAKQVCGYMTPLSVGLGGLTAVPELEPFKAACWAATGLTGCIALSAGLVAAASWIFEHRGPSPVSVYRPAKRGELRTIHKIGESFFTKVSSIASMTAWHSINPKIFYVFVRERKSSSKQILEIDGYFCLLPLQRHSVESIISGEKSACDLETSDICRPNQTPAALYVGAIAARSSSSRGIALQSLRTEICRLARGKLDTVVLAKPVTPDGLGLLQMVGISPQYDEPLGKVHFATLAELIPPRARTRRSRASPQRL